MATLARVRRNRNPTAVEDAVAGWIFVIPSLIIFCVFIFGPIIYTFWLSLHKWDVITPIKPWVGLSNFRQAFSHNQDFNIALRNTIWYSVGVVPVQTILGLLLAVLANRKIRGKSFFRTAFYFPSISSSVVIAVIFLWLYQENGLINFFLRKIGFPTPTPPWLSNPRGIFDMFFGLFGIHGLSPWVAGPSVALVSIMMLNIWTTMGTMMVIFLAGLQDIPGDVYEASALDGASRWQMFRDITVPLLKPITLFVVTLGIIGTLQVFDQIWVMTSGGPVKSTTTLSYLIYLEGFQNFSMGYAAAIAVILFAIILVVFLIQRRLVGQTEEQ